MEGNFGEDEVTWLTAMEQAQNNRCSPEDPCTKKWQSVSTKEWKVNNKIQRHLGSCW